MTGPNERDEIAALLMSAVVIPGPIRVGKEQAIVLTSSEATRAADALMPWLAERDRRTAATAVRTMGAKFRTEARETWGGDVGWTTTGSKVATLAASWCDNEADRVEQP